MGANEGRFVVLEGIDGCGSTTQVERLVAELGRRGLDVRRTAEPTSGPVGRLIREGLGARLRDASAADRADHNETLIGPALAAGAWVVSDRYDLSSLAYQSATAADGSMALPWIRELNQRARRPDLTIVLDVDPAVAAERRRHRERPQEIYEVDDVQVRLAGLYARASELVPGDRLEHVPSVGTVEAVASRVLTVVEPWIPPRSES
jgi:dTMP kinase